MKRLHSVISTLRDIRRSNLERQRAIERVMHDSDVASELREKTGTESSNIVNFALALDGPRFMAFCAQKGVSITRTS
jgi:hypothetical protein